MQTRVLVTHGIHFLPEVDEVCGMLCVGVGGDDGFGWQVIVVQDGRITESGPYETLLKCACCGACWIIFQMRMCFRNNGAFSRFIAEFKTEGSESVTDGEDSKTRIASLKV